MVRRYLAGGISVRSFISRKDSAELFGKAFDGFFDALFCSLRRVSLATDVLRELRFVDACELR